MNRVSGGTVAQEWTQRSLVSVVANIHVTIYSQLAHVRQHNSTQRQDMESVVASAI